MLFLLSKLFNKETLDKEEEYFVAIFERQQRVKCSTETEMEVVTSCNSFHGGHGMD